jgi:hypothetical protein
MLLVTAAAMFAFLYSLTALAQKKDNYVRSVAQHQS